jgi:hypothetical protein
MIDINMAFTETCFNDCDENNLFLLLISIIYLSTILNASIAAKARMRNKDVNGWKNGTMMIRIRKTNRILMLLPVLPKPPSSESDPTLKKYKKNINGMIVTERKCGCNWVWGAKNMNTVLDRVANIACSLFSKIFDKI